MGDWRNFRRRYRQVIGDIHERYPGFWMELRDLAESRDRIRATTRGATVRDFPPTREQGTQASGGRTLGQCLFGVAAPGQRHVDTQTEATVIQTEGTQTGDFPSAIAAVPSVPLSRGRGRGIRPQDILRRPGLPPAPERPGAGPTGGPSRLDAGPLVPTGPPTRGSSVCWNCRSADHRYSNCPWPRDRQYCYGCGREDVTLRTCPRCREDWRDLGPYHPDRGHLGH